MGTGAASSPPPTLHALLVLGLSGGAVPCPSALVVLLTAVAIHRIPLGIALIASFSAGLAVTLSVVGCLFVVARGVIERPAERGGFASPVVRRGLRLLPIVSTLVVLVLGLVLCFESVT